MKISLPRPSYWSAMAVSLACTTFYACGAGDSPTTPAGVEITAPVSVATATAVPTTAPTTAPTTVPTDPPKPEATRTPKPEPTATPEPPPPVPSPTTPPPSALCPYPLPAPVWVTPADGATVSGTVALECRLPAGLPQACVGFIDIFALSDTVNFGRSPRTPPYVAVWDTKTFRNGKVELECAGGPSAAWGATIYVTVQN
jgi:hypothetical protein